MKINFNYTKDFFSQNELMMARTEAESASSLLLSRKGEGNDYIGWLDLPERVSEEEITKIMAMSKKINEESKVLVVLGIGGSYLGAKSATQMLGDYYNNKSLEVIFAGNNLSSNYLYEVYNHVKDVDFSLNIISKSGSTTETSVATRIFLELLVKKYGNKAYDRVYATTDLYKGILHDICVKKNISMLEVPDDIGGRYSVLTAVGLLPICAAGYDIRKILSGAGKAKEDIKNNPSDILGYASRRYLAFKKGYAIDLLSSFEPKMHGFIEWYKQLFAESEGKDGVGLFPTGAIFSTDLHSIGQMIQQGKRNIIETIISIKKPKYDVLVGNMEDNLDGLDFLKDTYVNKINESALKATALAHYDGGVPVTIVEIDEINEFNYGYMVYFYMYMCAISAYMLKINPFNQPGVEAYKKNMFALIGKPGYEKLREEILNKIEGDN